MSELSKINRKLKSAMKHFIKNEDEGALRSISELTKARAAQSAAQSAAQAAVWDTAGDVK